MSMQRGFAKSSQVPTSYILGHNLLALCVNYELWVLDHHLFLGVVRTSRGARKKVGSRKFRRWATIYVAQSNWLTAASRIRKVNLRSLQEQRLLRMWWSRNLIRWDGPLTFCDFSDFHSQSVVPKKTDYAIATVKEVLTLAQSAASVIPVPFLKEAIGIALNIIQLCEVRWIPSRKVANDWSNSILGSIGCWTKSQRAASQGRRSHDRYRGPRNAQGRRRWQCDCCEDCRRYRTRYQRATQVRPTNGGLWLLLMTLQYSWDNQWGFIKNQRSESMGYNSLQTTQYECTRWMYESAFKCYAEVHGVYLEWRSWQGD